MSTVSSRDSEAAKTKPSQKLTSFSISSILGESHDERRAGDRHPETRGETGSHRDLPTREETLSPRETVRGPASVFDPEATAKLAAMTAWYPWIFQHAKQYPHFPFVEGMYYNNNYYICANILGNQVQWRNKTNGRSNFKQSLS